MTILTGIAPERGGDRDRRTGALARFTFRGLLLLAVAELAVLALAGMDLVVSGNPG